MVMWAQLGCISMCIWTSLINMKLWILLLSLSVGVLTESPPVNPCNSSPCQNGGWCFKSSRQERGYFCRCEGGYTGEYCQNGKVIFAAYFVLKLFSLG